MPRDYNHDYRSRCIYHITITKAPLIPSFSFVKGSSEAVRLELTPIGTVIEKNIRAIPQYCPHLRLLQYVVMPDHIHFLIFVTARIEKPLGSYIGMFKVKTGQEIRNLFLATPHAHNNPHSSDAITHLSGPIFNPDFYDRILRPTHSLNVIFNYIRTNPHRLRVRQLNPNFFQRINQLSIMGTSWQAYGNLHLLDNPFKRQVVVHRRDSEEERQRNLTLSIYYASNGGVLVSPFISEAEKRIRKEAEAAGAKIILITNESFPEKFKPAAHNFILCEQGKLLIMAPLKTMPPTRQTFMLLNSLAEHLEKNFICSSC